MEIINFDIEELNKLEQLLQKSNNVTNIIDLLCTLEIKGKHNSEEYNKKLEELVNAINMENEQYRKTNLTYQECLKFAKLLSEQTNIPMFDSKPTTAIKYQYNKTIKRVINILINIMENNDDYHLSVINDTDSEKLKIFDLEITQESLIKSFKNNIKIQKAIIADINSIFISILQEAINKKEYKHVKNQLIKIKYHIITIHKELEQLLLQNNFQVPKKIYINSKIINEILQEKEESYDIVRFTELKTKAQMEINKLLRIKDIEYDKQTTYINSIISSFYLRALFSLMTNEEINNLKKEFIDTIENPNYLKEHFNDRISENIIITTFKCFQFDKERTLILSTKSK